MIEEIKKNIAELFETSEFKTKVELLNDLREFIHEISPFKNEPVDFVKWIPNENVIANDYNPNKVAPPEMELLEVSIINDGYTQPIVSWPKDNKNEVVDGFHRNRVGKESKLVKQRIFGYLPVVEIRKEQTDKNNRIASTIRHNRARGKHQVDAMSEIVIELKNRNWTNQRISKELGMDEDEILRLCQISGLQDIFKDEDFSRSWNIEDSELEYEDLTDEITEEEKKNNEFRTINTDDDQRIFHTFDQWECYSAGLYNTTVDGMNQEQCERAYFEILTNDLLFSQALEKITTEWKNSCEHYLTNKAMNRLAYLGQAAVCLLTKVPQKYCSGWSLLNEKQQENANRIALFYLNKWLKSNGYEETSLKEAISEGRQVNIY